MAPASPRGSSLSRPPAASRAPDGALSPRQRDVASLAAAGATVGEIARTLGCGVATVKSHLLAVYRILGVGSRLELKGVLEP